MVPVRRRSIRARSSSRGRIVDQRRADPDLIFYSTKDMRTRILCAAAVMCFPAAAWAQDGLRSASLPERPLTSALSSERGDRFLAEPDTYLPRKHRRDTLGPFPGQIPPYWYLSEVLLYPYPYPYPYPSLSLSPPSPNPPSPNPPPPNRTPAAAAAPGVPKTFYVIAGCYAGDTPPRPAWLPPGCDPSSVRVIPP